MAVKPYLSKLRLAHLAEWFYLRILRLRTARVVTSEFRDDLTIQVLRFRKFTWVASKGSVIKIPLDNVIYNYVRAYGYWEKEEILFLKSIFENYRNSPSAPIFLDLGANIGLVSMQLLNQCSFSFKSVLVEPLPVHVSCIQFNLAQEIETGDVIVLPIALGVESKEIEFHTEIGNQGNSSAQIDAVRGSTFRTASVKMLSADDFFFNHMSSDLPIVLKSDMQGFDGIVLAAMPLDFWRRVVGGVIEIWALPNVRFQDLSKLLDVLSTYFEISWNSSMEPKIGTDELEKFWLSKSHEHQNLYFNAK